MKKEQKITRRAYDAPMLSRIEGLRPRFLLSADDFSIEKGEIYGEVEDFD